MTAEEARELTNGSMKRKGPIYRMRLIWMCGLINTAIEKRAEEGHVYYTHYFNTWREKQLYYPVVKKSYENLGYDVHSSEDSRQAVFCWGK